MAKPPIVGSQALPHTPWSSSASSNSSYSSAMFVTSSLSWSSSPSRSESPSTSPSARSSSANGRALNRPGFWPQVGSTPASPSVFGHGSTDISVWAQKPPHQVLWPGPRAASSQFARPSASASRSSSRQMPSGSALKLYLAGNPVGAGSPKAGPRHAGTPGSSSERLNLVPSL